jgi:hypothetical protein
MENPVFMNMSMKSPNPGPDGFNLNMRKVEEKSPGHPFLVPSNVGKPILPLNQMS